MQASGIAFLRQNAGASKFGTEQVSWPTLWGLLQTHGFSCPALLKTAF